jgi:hypothetical protein
MNMKKPILLIASLFFILILFAQQPGLNTYIIYFSDKGVNKNAGLNPSIYLTEKSAERRIKQKIAFDQSDIPVNEEYVQDVIKIGATILARSRWFNTIVIEANIDMADKIAAFPFIAQIQILNDNDTKQHSLTISEKPFLKAESMQPWVNEIRKNNTTDSYDYGAAYNQINQLNGQYFHNNGFSGQGMIIAVIDAGFNSADVMTCFDSLRANNQIKGTRDFAQPGNNVYATTMATHGTSVLSCMGAYSDGQMVGTAPKADYWLLRSEVAESESILEEYFWVSAAEFADSIGADLINSSLGYTTFDDPATNHTYADMDGKTTVVTKGAEKAAEKGILVVNSAGNSGNSTWKYIGAPADGDSVFTIGAVDATGIRASFSSVGPTYDGRIKPTVVAQGVGASIFSPGGLGSGSGTSFSSPIICGMTACLWQALPDLNNMQIIEAIKSTASQAIHPDTLMGWGIPDYQRAYILGNKPADNKLLVYPNPFKGNLTIVFPVSIYGKYSLEIFNIQGKTVYSRQLNDGSIRSLQLDDIGNIFSGIYFIKVTNGLMIYSGKIIKM